MAMLWVLNQSDGGPTLLDIAERSGLAFDTIRDAADRLLEKGLLVPIRLLAGRHPPFGGLTGPMWRSPVRSERS